MPDTGLEFRDFLNEKVYSGGGKRLRNWKDDGFIEVWIHAPSRFYKRLFTLLPYVGEIEDEKTKKTIPAIRYFPYISHEEVNNFVKRTPPQQCPFLRFADWLKNNDNIDWQEIVWSASVGNRKKDRVLTKADFFGSKEHGGDWRSAMKLSIQYIMAVVDNKNVKDGLVVATEKFSIGENIKKCVKQMMDSKGPELGDPGKNPYCFKFVYDANADRPENYYQVYAVERIERTPEVDELLASEPIDMTEYLLPSDPSMVRHIMEAHIPLDNVPFDEFFDNTQPVFSQWNQKDTSFEVENDELKEPAKTVPAKAQPKPTATPVTTAPVATTPAEPEAPTGNMIDCPSCKGSGNKRGVQCRVCGGVGQVPGPDDDEAEETTAASPPPAPKAPTPAATAPATPVATTTKRVRGAAAPPPPPPPPEQPDDDMDQCGNCGKNIPQDVSACPHCGVPLD